jgi:hypothetical protein
MAKGGWGDFHIKVEFDEYAENYQEILQEQLGFFDGNEGYFAEYKIEIIKKLRCLEPILGYLPLGGQYFISANKS